MAVRLFFVSCLIYEGRAGWREAKPSDASEKAWREVSCNMDVLTMDSWSDRFLTEFYLQKPAILRGWVSPVLIELQARLDRDALLKDFGGTTVRLGSFFELSHHGAGTLKMELKDYIKKHFDTAYLFDRGEFLASSKLAESWLTVPGLNSTGKFGDSVTGMGARPTFALGSNGQGIPFHWHVDSYSVQLHGSKRWAIYAPHKMTPTGFLATESLVTWLQTRTGGKKFVPPTWECKQDPGDILYVPEGYFHATACIGDSVGLTHLARDSSATTAFHVYSEAGAARGGMSRTKKIELLQQASRLDSSNALIWSKMANLFANDDGIDGKKAMKLFKKALKANPLCLDAHHSIMWMLQKLGDKDAMEKHVQTYTEKYAMELSPQTPNAPMGRSAEL